MKLLFSSGDIWRLFSTNWWNKTTPSSSLGPDAGDTKELASWTGNDARCVLILIKLDDTGIERQQAWLVEKGGVGWGLNSLCTYPGKSLWTLPYPPSQCLKWENDKRKKTETKTNKLDSIFAYALSQLAHIIVAKALLFFSSSEH